MKTETPTPGSRIGAAIRRIDTLPRRIFACGDIHGCSSELEVLLSHLESEQGLGADDLLVFIGDYIDRGPGSRDVIERLLQVRAKWPRTVFLKGNHEDMLLAFLGLGGEGGDVYLANGGNAFFASYGIQPLGALSGIIQQLPSAHLEFIKTLELGVSVGDYLFVHAGINPANVLENQAPADLLWIRGEFIRAKHSLGKTVVFGHTTFNEVYLDLPYKIGIDTGAIYGNKLSVVELSHGDLFQVDVGERQVKTSRIKELLGGGSR